MVTQIAIHNYITVPTIVLNFSTFLYTGIQIIFNFNTFQCNMLLYIKMYFEIILQYIFQSVIQLFIYSVFESLNPQDHQWRTVLGSLCFHILVNCLFAESLFLGYLQGRDFPPHLQNPQVNPDPLLQTDPILTL